MLRIHQQRERAMQRQNRERTFPLKMSVGALLCVGILFLSVGVYHEYQDHRNLREHSMNMLLKGNKVDTESHRFQKVSVPLPPNMERRYQNEKEVEPNAKSNENHAKTEELTHHRHAIPSTLIFTYHTNLLTTTGLVDDEDIALSENVKQTLSFHPQSSVRFLTDADCLQSIRAALGPHTNLTTYFTNEEHGMFKADICRGAALYETGGLYFDVDIEARMSLFEAIQPHTRFVTTLVHKDSKHLGNFFQAFVGATPRHPVMKRYLELFVLHYEGKLNVGGPLGVYLLRMAYDDCSDKNDVELWQEMRYDPRWFPYIKRDRWGQRRACQMLVVASERVVPLFSRSNGSRMCGGKDTHKKG